MKCKKIKEVRGVPFYVLNLDKDEEKHRYVKISEYDLADTFPGFFSLKEIIPLQYRAVPIDRLKYTLKHGVDVNPTNSPIFCSDLEKAMEYGEWPKVVMGFNYQKLDKTFREVPSDIEKSKLNTLKATFPTVEKSIDRKKIWLSRLCIDDTRRCTYEISYGYWIPGSPWNCLKILLLIGLNEAQVGEYAKHLSD